MNCRMLPGGAFEGSKQGRCGPFFFNNLAPQNALFRRSTPIFSPSLPSSCLNTTVSIASL